jgi:aryl-alcohol dehydrogenase-like predicted oxidoreductase
MPTRVLGRTGEKVSLVGIGGYHIGIPKDEQTSLRIVRMALTEPKHQRNQRVDSTSQ